MTHNGVLFTYINHTSTGRLINKYRIGFYNQVNNPLILILLINEHECQISLSLKWWLCIHQNLYK